jgi:hypothetical protein
MEHATRLIFLLVSSTNPFYSFGIGSIYTVIPKVSLLNNSHIYSEFFWKILCFNTDISKLKNMLEEYGSENLENIFVLYICATRAVHFTQLKFQLCLEILINCLNIENCKELLEKTVLRG